MAGQADEGRVSEVFFFFARTYGILRNLRKLNLV